MSVPMLAQLGFGVEANFGTPVVVDRFFEFQRESLLGKYERIESSALRAGTKFQRADRWTPNPKGAAGSVELEVLSKGYAFFLEHMLGKVTAGTADANDLIAFTGEVGNMKGKYLTAQVGRPDNNDTAYSFVYSGGKITSWEISNSVDELLMLTLDLDFMREFMPGDSEAGSAGALATPSYPAGSEIMSSLGGSFKVGGVELPAKDVSFKAENGLDAERYYLHQTGLKREQTENELRVYSWEATVEFEGQSQLNRVASLTTAGAIASIEASWRAPTKVGMDGGGGYPTLTVSVPAGRNDEPPPSVEGASALTHKVGGKILAPASGESPLTIVYKSLDVTA